MSPEKRSDLLPGTLDLIVLQTLSGGPAHGYGIARLVRQRSEEVLQIGEGSLYPALQRMMARGWLESEWQRSETGRRARYYSLTTEGELQLEQERGDYRRMAEAIERVLQPV